MSEGEKRCDCCGELSDGFISSGRSGSVEAPDCFGAYVSWDCARQAVGTDGWKELYSRIRARRRSAQPAVASVDGKPLNVGDRVNHVNANKRIVGTVKQLTLDPVGRPGALVAWDNQQVTTPHGEALRHADAAPPGGEKAKAQHVELRSQRAGKMRAMLVTTDGNERLVPASECLGEVENQLALVARLDFDLRMLKLMGQGWSRGDLQAHISLMSRAAEKPRGGGR